MMEKKCSRCKQFKPPENFNKDKQKKDGLCLVCKTCKAEIHKERVLSGDYKYVPVTEKKVRVRGLTAGVGINDAPYKVEISELVVDSFGNKFRRTVWHCPYHRIWSAMLHRAYIHKERPSYEGCSVSPDWIYFTDFKAWMEQQDWEGLHLDKDLLKEGNKEYGPETCVFIPHYINVAISTERVNSKHGPGIYIIGKKYVAKLTQDGSNREIGRFNTKEEAVKAYKAAKADALDKILEKYRTEAFFNPVVESAILLKIQTLKIGN